MGDTVATSKKSDTPVEDALANLREALIDDGMDPVTADAKLHALQPTGTGVVGNLADLQRVGAVKAPDENEPEYVMPPAAETEA